MKSLALGTGLVVVSLCFSGVTQAATIYNNGGPAVTNLGGSVMSDTKQAQDFLLTGITNLTGVRFWNLQGTAADYAGNIFYQIFSDASGLPGVTAIASGLVTPTRIAAGTVLGFSQFQNDFTIAVNGLTAGTYWLALHNGPTTTTAFSDFYWSWADLNAVNTPTNPGSEFALNPLGTSWTSNDQEGAFLLSGSTVGSSTPEPATFVFVGASLMALGIYRRRLS